MWCSSAQRERREWSGSAAVPSESAARTAPRGSLETVENVLTAPRQLSMFHLRPFHRVAPLLREP